MKTVSYSVKPIARLGALAVLIPLAIAACGGGQDGNGRKDATSPDGDSAAVVASEGGVSPNQSSDRSISLQQQGARLNAEELERIAQTGILPKPFEGPLLSGAEGSTPATLNSEGVAKSLAKRKSASSRVPAYRFYNGRTGAHFFTTSTTERDNVINNVPAFNYEGPAFHTSNITIPGLSPVHRFYNRQTGVHFYTISEAERASVVANLPQFTYEGIAYYASTLPGTGYTPLYRFFYATRGFHFYTNSQSERDTIIATLPQYSYEGIGYYVLGDDWQTPAVPHTGITDTQCYTAGSDGLFDCGLRAVMLFNNQQDGHRTAVNPMSYSALGAYPLTSCVKDNVTGLIWEGKTPTGERAGSNTYTNYGDGTVGDASAYVNRVNQLNLCGYSDWRLPAVDELQGIAHYGRSVDPFIDTLWFPNSASAYYWSSSRSISSPQSIRIFTFEDGRNSTTGAGSSWRVRLVRGAPWSGPRHMVTGMAYAGDAPDNAVIDRTTGLTWRRCLEGQRWNGSTCMGVASDFSHENALIQAREQSGWRLPNLKELGSLVDRGRSGPALDTLSFPGASSLHTLWSSSPYVGGADYAWYVGFYNGSVSFIGRGNGFAVRLVRASQ